MNNYEDWAQLVAKRLKGEADIIAAIEKDELDDAAATEAFARAVLEPFLPENFGLGAGRVVDAFGNYSEYLDIVVYNRDFPRIKMRGAHEAYLYESVLAAFAVRAKFIRKTFFDAMNVCASLSHLETNLDKTVLVKLAKKNGLRPGPNKTFIHDDPLRTGRFELIGRPPAFVFGFSGIKNSHRQLQENIELWIDNRSKARVATPMKAVPAVIATQGCFAWRNAAPLALSNREMLGIGGDPAPVRLIVLQLLYLLNRRLNVTSDGYGLKPNLNAYLSQFSPPKFESGVGNVAEMISFDEEGATETEQRAARDTARFEPARDHAAAEMLAAAEKAKEEAAAKSKPAVKPAAVAPAPAPEPAPAAPEPAPAAAAPEPAPEAAPAAADNDSSAVFDKPSPFASAPAPAAAEPAAASASSSDAAVFDNPSPFGSAPIPQADDAPMPEPEMPRSPAPAAPLGSAPIPPMQDSSASTPDPKPPTAPLGSAPIPPSSPEPETPPPSAPLGSAPIPPMQSQPAAEPAPKVIPPKPPVDIDLGGAESASEDAPAASSDGDEDFIETVVIPPNASASAKPQSSSTDAFIARVKEQLSTPESATDKEKDFSSTIPQ